MRSFIFLQKISDELKKNNFVKRKTIHWHRQLLDHLHPFNTNSAIKGAMCVLVQPASHVPHAFTGIVLNACELGN
jgi:hypothetical protein